MSSLPEVTSALEAIAPLRLAADWDVVGLLVAPRRAGIAQVLTCLTLTPEVAAEAVRAGADLVVTHHPLPFRPVPRITPETGPGRVLLDLIGHGIGVWSSHTAWDSAAGGINDQLAAILELSGVGPIEPDAIDPRAGFGRRGRAAAGTSVATVARSLAAALQPPNIQIVGPPEREAGVVGIVCGSGGDLVPAVAAAGCTTLLTGELKLHQAVEARAAGLAVIALGHHTSEHFAMAELGRRLMAALPGLAVRPAEHDHDPIGWLR
jgi:dinuclear metal center YbgI/SA1388 family protein